MSTLIATAARATAITEAVSRVRIWQHSSYPMCPGFTSRLRAAAQGRLALVWFDDPSGRGDVVWRLRLTGCGPSRFFVIFGSYATPKQKLLRGAAACGPAICSRPATRDAARPEPS